MTTTTDTYTLSFDKEADGGPIHLLYLLKEYVLQFDLTDRDETLIARVLGVDYDTHEVIVTPFIDSNDEYENEADSPRSLRLKIGQDFQHVTYC